MRVSAILVLIIGVLVAPLVEAADRTAEQMAGMLPDRAIKALVRDPAQFRAAALKRLYELHPDGAATPERILTKTKIDRARVRSQRLSKFLSQDLDGDGAVSTEEFELSISLLSPAQRAQMIVFRDEADLDRDGTISFAEAVARFDRDLNQPARTSSGAWDIMILDIDEDGRVDGAEALKAIDAIAAFIEGKEAKRQRAFNRSKTKHCLVPKPTEQAMVVAISGYGGDALSSVAAEGQNFVTTATTIHVEEGEGPIWVFATAYEPIIWNIVGQTKRVERFVVQTNLDYFGPGAGVVGVSKDRVDFLPPGSCFQYLTSAAGGKATLAKAKLKTATGKQVGSFIAAQTLTEFAVPSGKKLRKPNSMIVDMSVLPDDEIPGGPDYGPPSGPEKKTRTAQALDFKMVEWMLSESKPGGVLEVDPKEVAAPKPVEKFEILPHFAGVLQLMEEGSLWRTSDGYFVIQKPIKRLPPGLPGGNRARFILADGVPLPDGGPWNVQVVSEKTGECLSGGRCR